MQRHLFTETSHSPSLTDLVGYDRAQEITDFCFIANPYYPTRAMIRELQRELPMLIKSYPSSNPAQAQAHLGEVLRVNPDHLVIGNGASELIALLEENLVTRIAIPVPTFGEYLEKLRDGREALLYELDPAADYQLDLPAYARWVTRHRLRAALVINPGNPTGQFHPLADVLDLLGRLKSLELVVIDESFIDFAGVDVPTVLPHVDEFPNLLVVRSMSKHCGVPGLRLGYCCTANVSLLDRLRRLIPVWNVNSIAEYFLGMLPPTDAAYQRARRRVIGDVRSLHAELSNIAGFHAYRTGANFILLRVEVGLTARELQHELLVHHAAYVRDCSNKVGMDDRHIRVASQGRAKDRVLIDALRSISGNTLPDS